MGSSIALPEYGFWLLLLFLLLSFGLMRKSSVKLTACKITEQLSEADSELEAKLFDAFDLFDHERNKTIDFRELGTVIRSIGGVPTEAELMQLVRELENDPPNGYINFEKFLPAMLEAFEQNRFRGASEQELIKAFSILDADHKGYLSVEEIEAHMTTEGEPFSTDEMEEMLASATDVTRGKVIYREYVVLLTTYDEESL